jgi:hypothetical protein
VDELLTDRWIWDVHFLAFFIFLYIYTLWLFVIAMEDMTHRNRWFTELQNGDDLSMANC